MQKCTMRQHKGYFSTFSTSGQWAMIDKKLKCKKCNSEYLLTSMKTTMRDKDCILCEVCGNELFSWNEARIFSAKLLKGGGNDSRQ